MPLAIWGKEFWAEGTAGSKARRLLWLERWRVAERDGPK